MNRREFLKTSAVGISAPSVLLFSQENINMNNPIVLATWKHGLPANDAAWKILKKGGIILLGTPDFDSGCARLFGNNYRLLNDPTHISLFSNDSMHRFLRDHGFTIDYVEYPFFNTRHFTEDNLKALFNTSKVSPPFYGNFMTFYCQIAE